MRRKRPVVARESALAGGWVVHGDGPEMADPGVPDPDVEPTAETAVGVGETAEGDAGRPGQFSNGGLVVLGLLGGLFLLYAWVWLSWAQYYAQVNAVTAAASGAIGGVLQQIVYWAAPFAPVLWFIAALVLNRGRGFGRVVCWIAVGAVLLFPLPVLVGVVF